jgi:hypothetical protein
MAYFVVNHVSDENKTDGLVESYQMVTFQNEDGSLFMKRVNFVHWPKMPNPFVHEEYNEALVFANVYVPEEDNAEEDEEDEEETYDSDIVALLENDYPEIYEALLKEAELNAEQEEDEEDEVEVNEEDENGLESTN